MAAVLRRPAASLRQSLPWMAVAQTGRRAQGAERWRGRASSAAGDSRRHGGALCARCLP